MIARMRAGTERLLKSAAAVTSPGLAALEAVMPIQGYNFSGRKPAGVETRMAEGVPFCREVTGAVRKHAMFLESFEARQG